jgi:acetyl esterase/lipase
MPGSASTWRALADLLDGADRRSYGPGRHQVAELRLPDADPPHPVAVVLHGGYWRAGFSRRITRPIAADLARRGWASWNLEYRRTGRRQGGGWPATFEDVAAGIDALADVEPGLVALDRVALVGHSAGGHLALWAAARPGLPDGAPGAGPRVPAAAVAALGAVSDLEAAVSLLEPGEPVYDLLGGSPATVPDRYKLANPIRRLPIGIPILLVHSADDETVPVKRSRDFARAAGEAGDHVDLVQPPGAGHREVVDPRRPAWGATADWLAELGWVGSAAAAA